MTAHTHPATRESHGFGVALTMAILVLTLTTGYIHLGLGGLLFTLNALGYAGLAALYVIGSLAPHALVARFSWFPRVALAGYALVGSVYVAGLCYAIYSFIMPLSSVGSATYLRKVAASNDIAPSLAMGLSLQHAAVIVVPVTTGFILNFVGYQVPFLIACVFALMAVVVTRQLNPATQKAPERMAEDEERLKTVPVAASRDGDHRTTAVAGS